MARPVFSMCGAKVGTDGRSHGRHFNISGATFRLRERCLLVHCQAVQTPRRFPYAARPVRTSVNGVLLLQGGSGEYRDPHGILNLPKGVKLTEKMVHVAHRTVSKRIHPDVSDLPIEESTAQMADANWARDTLLQKLDWATGSRLSDDVQAQLQYIRWKAARTQRHRRYDPEIARIFATGASSSRRASHTHAAPQPAPTSSPAPVDMDVAGSAPNGDIGEDVSGSNPAVFIPFSFSGGQPERIFHFTDAVLGMHAEEVGLHWGFDESMPSDCGDEDPPVYVGACEPTARGAPVDVIMAQIMGL